jgi:citrate synthase
VALTDGEGRGDAARIDVVGELVDAALVLSADQGLVPSTVAARVAASVQADPYSVVVAGLGAIAGRLHGAACLGAEELLDEVARTGRATTAIGARLRRGERIPGFGEAGYPGGDPRATLLLDRLTAAAASTAAATVVDPDAVARAAEVVDVMASRGLPKPNIDFALATLTSAAGLVPGASEALIAIARCAGWLAHALEEYAHPSRFDPSVVPAPSRR